MKRQAQAWCGLFGAAVLLSACGQPSASQPDPTPGPANTDIVANTPAPLDDCAVIGRIRDAISEPVPFESLRARASTFPGGDVIPNSYETDLTFMGGACKIGTLGGWNANDPDSQVLSCTLYEKLFDGFEPAQAIYQDAKTKLTECLGADWTAGEEESAGENGLQLVFERDEDRARREASDFYLYPVLLKHDDGKGFGRPRGSFPGDQVSLAFQFQDQVSE